MHPSAMAYVAETAKSLNLENVHVLEVGSYDVNGSVRPIFADAASYLGVDVRNGPGVDQVIDGFSPYPFADEAFGVVVSTEMLEHDLRPWASVAEMARVLRPAGWLVLTARGYDERGCYELHDTLDVWRFSVRALEELALCADLQVTDARPDPDHPGAFLTARKVTS